MEHTPPPALCHATHTNTPAAALAAFEQAVSVRRAQQQAIIRANDARAGRRQALLKLQEAGDTAAAQQLAELGDDEPVPQLPAKLLNNTAVLKYRCALRVR
jgi:hypothetical protein